MIYGYEANYVSKSEDVFYGGELRLETFYANHFIWFFFFVQKKELNVQFILELLAKMIFRMTLNDKSQNGHDHTLISASFF